jgi:predicted nucleic-acid-binding protein
VGKLLGLANLETEDREVVLRSLGWYTAGMDFADALHPASNADAKRLVTFDRKLGHHATQQSTVPPVVRLLSGHEQEGGT